MKLKQEVSDIKAKTRLTKQTPSLNIKNFKDIVPNNPYLTSVIYQNNY